MPCFAYDEVPGPQEKKFTLEKAAPEQVTVTLHSDPEGAEITEGAMVIGRTPKLWTTTTGDHLLKFNLPGYSEVTQPVTAVANKEATVKLDKLAKPKKAQAPGDLGDIKSER